MTINNTEFYPREFEMREILLIAYEVYKSHYSVLLPVAFVVYLPMNIFLAFFPITSLSEFDPAYIESWFRIFGSMNLAVYLSFFGNIILAIALKKTLYTHDFSFPTLLSDVSKKFMTFARANLFIMFVVFVCFNLWMYFSVTYPTIFLFLLIPVFVYLIYWTFAIYIFAFNDINLYQAMKSSYSIVNGRWSRVFTKVIAFILISLLTSLMIGLPYSYLHDTIIMKIIYSNLVSVITSFYVVAFIVFYVNFDDTKK